MKNVVLKTTTDEFIQLQDSEGIDLPEWIRASGTGKTAAAVLIEQQIAQLTTQDANAILVPVNTTSQSLIAANDTTTFAEKMMVYVLSDQDQEIQYYEPLGDGFYFSPVTISRNGSIIKVQGERKHDWTFRIRAAGSPSVKGADEWTYNAQEEVLVVQKMGMQFEMVLSD